MIRNAMIELVSNIGDVLRWLLTSKDLGLLTVETVCAKGGEPADGRPHGGINGGEDVSTRRIL
jgi:hypothetical protein